MKLSKAEKYALLRLQGLKRWEAGRGARYKKERPTKAAKDILAQARDLLESTELRETDEELAEQIAALNTEIREMKAWRLHLRRKRKAQRVVEQFRREIGRPKR